VNVFCFFGFVKSLKNADSLFDKKLDPFLSNVYYIYWITKVLNAFRKSNVVLIPPISIYIKLNKPPKLDMI
jgi:hypothetical protein